MPFDYEVKFNLDDCVKKLGLEEKGRVQQFVTNEVLRLSEPYVPFDEANLYGNPGALKRSGRPENNNTEAVWGGDGAIYARRLYYHPEYNFQGAPMRGGNWVDRMLQNGGMKAIEDGARRIVNR